MSTNVLDHLFEVDTERVGLRSDIKKEPSDNIEKAHGTGSDFAVEVQIKEEDCADSNSGEAVVGQTLKKSLDEKNEGPPAEPRRHRREMTDTPPTDPNSLMSQKKRLVSLRQMELLIAFLENHRELALGKIRNREAMALSKKLWTECAAILNAEGNDDDYRMPREWQKWFTDYKSRLLNRVRLQRASQTENGGATGVDNQPLSVLEERLHCLLSGETRRSKTPQRYLEISPLVIDNHDQEMELNKAPKTSAERGREFRARKALLKQSKQQREPDAIVEFATQDRLAGPSEDNQVPGPSEIRTIEKRAKSAEATRRWREKKKGVRGSSKKQAKTAAQRMRTYRRRKKFDDSIQIDSGSNSLRPNTSPSPTLAEDASDVIEEVAERPKKKRRYRQSPSANVTPKSELEQTTKCLSKIENKKITVMESINSNLSSIESTLKSLLEVQKSLADALLVVAMKSGSK